MVTFNTTPYPSNFQLERSCMDPTIGSTMTSGQNHWQEWNAHDIIKDQENHIAIRYRSIFQSNLRFHVSASSTSFAIPAYLQ